MTSPNASATSRSPSYVKMHLRLCRFYLRRIWVLLSLGLGTSLTPFVVVAIVNSPVAKINSMAVFSSWLMVAWANVMLASLVACEIFGRDISEGSTVFFAQLPLCRKDRLACKIVATLVSLTLWGAGLGIVFAILLNQHAPPTTFGVHRLPAMFSLYFIWLLTASVTGLVSDRTGALAAALLVGVFVSFTVGMLSQYYFQPDFGFPCILVCGGAAGAVLASLFCFSCDVEI